MRSDRMALANNTPNDFGMFFDLLPNHEEGGVGPRRREQIEQLWRELGMRPIVVGQCDTWSTKIRPTTGDQLQDLPAKAPYKPTRSRRYARQSFHHGRNPAKRAILKNMQQEPIGIDGSRFVTWPPREAAGLPRDLYRGLVALIE